MTAARAKRVGDDGAMEYDAKTALIVVDVQNDFAHPEGSLYVQEGEQVIPVINEEVACALEAGAAVVYTQDWHPVSTPHFARDGGLWPVHCVAETWGAELHGDLHFNGAIIRKGTGADDGYSGFSECDLTTGKKDGTDLEEVLREKGIEKVVIAGLATDYCVKATTLDATRRGFDATVLTEAIRAVDLKPGDGDSAAREMEEAGAHLS